ncbi:hypothetical protein Pcinc_031512 [Petrolisthes cinctipes]|uniref:C-type lectin domain-containing protein n=1 Tax=Petrolisthes cinctipes TaxID=88211 RepID=A0AAE1K2I1_PETCI|nr:hypothetical protein Pcinc_031512 [Petrolisthes cinctipes]
MSSLFVLVAVLVVVVSGQRTFRYDGTVVDQSGSSQLFQPQAPVVLMQQPQDQNSGPVVFLEQTSLGQQGPVFPFQSQPRVIVGPNELEPVDTQPDVVVLPPQVQPTVFISPPQTFSPAQTGQSVFVSSPQPAVFVPQPQPTVTVSQPQQVGSVFQPQQVGSVFQPQPTVTVSRPQSFQSSFVSGVSSVTVSGQCNIVSGSLVDQVVGREVWHFSWCHQASRTYTWYQARDYCTSLGQGFASISVENQITTSVLSAVMSAHGQRTTWTSGNRLTTKRWSWSKTGVQFFYTNWARTGRLGRPQPDNANGDELCLSVVNSYTDGAAWHDASCTDLSPVVCQAYRY